MFKKRTFWLQNRRKKIVAITNDIETKELQQAIENTKNKEMEGINIHLNAALSMISNKKSPNYRNSIKESISAVESICRFLTSKNTLGEAIKSLEKEGIFMANQFKSGIEKLYAYTNDKESGIRHAILEDHKEPDFADAKYMLLICSGFVNYLIDKTSTKK